eukprot:983540_1
MNIIHILPSYHPYLVPYRHISQLHAIDLPHHCLRTVQRLSISSISGNEMQQSYEPGNGPNINSIVALYCVSDRKNKIHYGLNISFWNKQTNDQYEPYRPGSPNPQTLRVDT